MDWKPERAAREKVRDFKKEKQKKWLLKNAEGRTLCVGLEMVTSSRLLINNGLSPQEASVATLCRTSPHQWLDLFNNIISMEVCLVFVPRCQSASHLICHVSSHRVHLSHTVIYSYKLHPYIHTFINPYNHTSIISCIHTFMRTQHVQHVIYT